MQFVIITGMSGAGKSTLLHIFEDLGYYCVDNLPPQLIKNFADFCLEGSAGIERVVLGIDIRGGKRFSDLSLGLEALSALKLPYKILFLDATDETLQNRYKESRRSHPLRKNGSILEGIMEERQILAPIKEQATYIIDTSLMLTRQLRQEIHEIFVENKEFGGLMVHIQSFGFKYGIPTMADLVFDVRFMVNPFYIDELKTKTGLDEDVRAYVMNNDVSQRFVKDLYNMMDFLIPHYHTEGKNQLIIAIGCTGGKHRSVTISRELEAALKKSGHSVVLNHRDVGKS